MCVSSPTASSDSFGSTTKAPKARVLVLRDRYVVASLWKATQPALPSPIPWDGREDWFPIPCDGLHHLARMGPTSSRSGSLSIYDWLRLDHLDGIQWFHWLSGPEVDSFLSLVLLKGTAFNLPTLFHVDCFLWFLTQVVFSSIANVGDQLQAENTTSSVVSANA